MTEGNSGNDECHLHGHPRRAQRPDRDRRLCDRGRKRDVARRLRSSDRPADVRAGADNPHGHRSGQRRPRRRGHRDLLPQPFEPGNATIVDTQGGGTIIDDDGAPTLSVDDVAVTEGNAGSSARPSRSPWRRPAARGQRRLLDAGRDGDLPGATTQVPAATSSSLPARRRETFTVLVNGDTARRDRRELHRQPLQSGQRDDR